MLRIRKRSNVLLPATLASLCLLCLLSRAHTAHEEEIDECEGLEEHFGLMMDGGSTGTRVHVYRWCFKEGENLPVVTHDHFLETKPGLSSYRDSTDLAGDSVKPLLDFALTKVPEDRRDSTLVYLKATAGLRLLPDPTREAVLDDVRDFISTYPFRFEGHHVGMMDGKDEAIYAWITSNYLLGTLDKPESTVGVLDLGGASAQITYAPVSEHPPSEHEVYHDIQVGGNNYRLYAFSHLGYGLHQAYERVEKRLHSLEEGHELHIGESERHHPCLNPGHSKELEADGQKATLHGKGDFEQCSQLIQEHLAENAAGDVPIKEVVPALIEHNFWAFSYFYDRLTEIDLHENPSLEALQTAAIERCGADHTSDHGARMCFDLTYIHALLAHGFNFDDQSEHRITVGKSIKGKELGWALGAMLSYIPSQGDRRPVWAAIASAVCAVAFALWRRSRRSRTLKRD